MYKISKRKKILKKVLDGGNQDGGGSVGKREGNKIDCYNMVSAPP